MVNSEAVLKRWKEYFEKLMNEENNRDLRTEEAEVVNKEVNCVSREVEERLECWRYALDRRGIKVSRSKAKYLCINGGNDDETVKMEDRKVPGVKEFKYLGSTVHESGSCEREVKKRVQAGWNGWRKVLGVICGRSLPARVKGKVYSSVVRPAMVYGLAVAVTKNMDHQWLYYQWTTTKNMDHYYGPPMVAVTKKQEEVAEMKMLRFAMEVTRKDKIKKRIHQKYSQGRTVRNKDEGGQAEVVWAYHDERPRVCRKKMMEMELPGKRKRGRLKRRLLDVVKEDTGEVGAKETDVKNRTVWRKIRCGYL